MVASTAQEWAAGIRDPAEVDWKALQALAFAKYPTVRRRVDSSFDYVPVSMLRKRLTQIQTTVVVIVFIVALLSPVVGVIAAACAHGGTGRTTVPSPPSPGRWVPVAGVSFAVTIVMIVFITVVWWRGGRTKGSGWRGYTAVCAILAIIAVPVAAAPAADADMASWQSWVLVIAVAAVLGVLSFVLQLAASKPEPEGDGVYSTARSVRAQRAIARLSPQQRDAARSDIDSAIHDLARRGVVSEADARRARAAELGCLPEQMTQHTSQDTGAASSTEAP